MKKDKIPFEKLKPATFFTFPNQMDDLFMKTNRGMIRIPNNHFRHTMFWKNSMYTGNTSYIILSKTQVRKRINPIVSQI